MNKQFFPSKFFAFLLAASALSSVPVNAANLGNIVFVGDSITQGSGTSAVSYRYSLWKHFVDAGITYSPVGSMNIFQGDGSTTSTLAPDYCGQTFNNTSEGHFGWDVAWVVSGESQGTRPNTGQNTGGLADWMATYSAVPDTATLLMGVNDLSRGSSSGATYTFAEIIENTKAVVQTLQAKAPNITVHVFSILPSAQSSWNWTSSDETPRSVIAEYNKELKSAVASGAWNTETSTVVYHDITAGFDPTNGVHTYDSLHPNAQGELIIAGNIARALGLEQRTAGLSRRGNAALAGQTSFSASASSGVSASFKLGGAATTILNSSSYWTLNDAGHIVVESAKSGASDLRFSWGASGKHEFTISLTLKMLESADASTNFLGIFGGNGSDVGVLYIGENGIYWNETSASNLLYGQTSSDYADGFMHDEQTLRMVWITASDDGAASGFYVWLGDQLIGEALSGTTKSSVVSDYANYVLFGDIGSAYTTYAEISEFSFDAEKAWAPTSIPEPSMFGLLAGLGALALAGTRRRRRK